MAHPPTRRILALDGGGIRGIFSLQILSRIEEVCRHARSDPGLVLRDVFDFFAGTSTGAIIATSLAWGMSVAQVEEFYTRHGPAMFSPTPWWHRWRSKYRADVIAKLFQDVFREPGARGNPALLGTRQLWAGDEPKYLMIVMRNASTGSPWPVCNNPRAKYNDPSLPDCNLHVPMWQLLRASTAAPAFFPPEEIQLGPRRRVFIDGAVSPYNNPALIAVLMATLPQFRIQWPTGPECLKVVSIGTGAVRVRLRKRRADRVNLLDHAAFAVPALLESVAAEQDMLCRVLGRCEHGHPLDAELGDLKGDGLLTDTEKRFAYVRYNRTLTSAEHHTLRRRSKRGFAIDNVDLIPDLQRIGREYAREAVDPHHIDP